MTKHLDEPGGSGSSDHPSEALQTTGVEAFLSDAGEPPVEEAGKTVTPASAPRADAEAQLRALERLGPVLASVQEQADRVEATQRRTDLRLANAGADAERVQLHMERLTHTVDTALSLKEDLAQFGELGGQAKAMLAATEEFRGQLDDVRGTLSEVREQHEGMVRDEQAHASALLELESHVQALKALHAEVLDRSGQIRSHQLQIDAQEQTTLEELAAIRSAVRKGVERSESASREFDSVSQRVTDLRETLEDLESRVGSLNESCTNLADVKSTADNLTAQLSTITEDCSGLDELEARVADVQSLHGDLLERSNEVAAQQQETDEKAQAALEELTAIREGVERSVERIESANRGVDSVSQRVGDLRDVLEDFDTRLHSLDDARLAITEVHQQADDLGARLRTITSECRDLDEQAKRIRSVHADVEQLNGVVREVAQRVGRIEEVRSQVDAVSQDLADLNGTSEAIADALEQARAANTEITRLQKEQSKAVSLMAAAQNALATVKCNVEDLDGMRPMVEAVREEAEGVNRAMTAIESRRERLEEVERRLGELESLGARLQDGEKGRPSRGDQHPDGQLGWYFNADWTFDLSTWEFGLQFRLAGRLKRGAALWFGPARLFVGWQKRYGRTEPAQLAVEQPAEPEGSR